MKKIFLQLLIPSFAVVVIFISCKKERSCEGCISGNKRPTAVAGPDQVITLPIDRISIDGSASYDPDGIISEWLWKKIAGPASFNIVNVTTAKTVIKNLTAGSYKFELSVKDDKGASAKDTMIVKIDAAPTTNHPPVANAGQEQTITLPTNSVTLDGNASMDPDNNISTYTWNKISGPSSFNIAYPNAVQTHVTNLVEGVYQFELKVTDAGMLVSKDTIGITVFPVVATLIIFTDQVWINACYQPDVPGACWINADWPSYSFNITDTTNILPDFASAILGVWVRMDTSSVWEQVPLNCWQSPDPYPQSNFTYCITSAGLSVLSWFLSTENLAGRRADVKIAF